LEDLNVNLEIKHADGGSYLSNVLLKHAQLQALMEAELTMLPRPLHFMVTLPKKKKFYISPPVCLCCMLLETSPT